MVMKSELVSVYQCLAVLELSQPVLDQFLVGGRAVWLSLTRMCAVSSEACHLVKLQWWLGYRSADDGLSLFLRFCLVHFH